MYICTRKGSSGSGKPVTLSYREHRSSKDTAELSLPPCPSLCRPRRAENDPWTAASAWWPSSGMFSEGGSCLSKLSLLLFWKTQTILVEYLVLLHLSESEEKCNVCSWLVHTHFVKILSYFCFAWKTKGNLLFLCFRGRISEFYTEKRLLNKTKFSKSLLWVSTKSHRPRITAAFSHDIINAHAGPMQVSKGLPRWH